MVQEVLRYAKSIGYQAYRISDHDGFGFLITPKGNVLTVNKGDYGGVHITFDYKPNRGCGSGCSCEDEASYEISREKLEKLEEAGYRFALRLKAPLYKDVNEWKETCLWSHWGLLREV